MNTKQIGDISQVKVMGRLLQKGYSVSVPFGDNQRYDLIFDDGKLNRVQCKTGRIHKNSVEFKTASTYGHRGRGRKTYNEEIEFFGVYCPENDVVYLVPIASVVDCESCASLRLVQAANNQIRNTRNAAEFVL